MATDEYVLDASVAAKWFLDDEDLVDIAERVLIRSLADEIRLHAPVTIWYELGHLLTKAQRDRNRPLTPKQSVGAYEKFFELPIHFHELDLKERLGALRFANKYHRTFYDSTYICLAMKLDCMWLTDERTLGEPLPPKFPKRNLLVLESLR